MRCPGSCRTHPASLGGRDHWPGPPRALSAEGPWEAMLCKEHRISNRNSVCVCVSHSVVSNSATLWTVACRAAQSTGFSRQEYWIGLPFPSQGIFLTQGSKVSSPALAADSSLLNPPGSPSSLQHLSSNHTYCPQGRRDILPCYQWFHVYKTWYMVCLRFPLFL